MTKAKGRHRRESGLPEISGAPEVNEEAAAADDEEEEYGKLEEYQIYLSDDIEHGYRKAEAAVVDRWEENRRRYFNG
jgi:hypothetical protein